MTTGGVVTAGPGPGDPAVGTGALRGVGRGRVVGALAVVVGVSGANAVAVVGVVVAPAAVLQVMRAVVGDSSETASIDPMRPSSSSPPAPITKNPTTTAAAAPLPSRMRRTRPKRPTLLAAKPLAAAAALEACIATPCASSVYATLALRNGTLMIGSAENSAAGARPVRRRSSHSSQVAVCVR